MPGFSLRTAAPVRPSFPALDRLKQEQLPTFQGHTVDRLPAILIARLQGLAGKFWGLRGLWEPSGLRWLLLGFAAVGLIGLPGPLWFLLANAASLILLYLWMPASPVWTVYYRELFPILAVVTAAGTWRVARMIGDAVGRRRTGWQGADLAAGLVTVGLLVAVPGTIERLAMAKRWQFQLRVGATNLERIAGAIPGRAIIFVAPGPPNAPYESLVWNEPDLETTRVWLAHDRGDDNARLVQLAPDRTPYLFDPGNPRRVAVWRPTGTVSASPGVLPR
jgi:hypothetical protein